MSDVSSDAVPDLSATSEPVRTWKALVTSPVKSRPISDHET
jgi:hypothetical protein